MFQAGAYTPDNLSSLLSEAQDNNLMAALGGSSYETTGLTHDEMLNFAPTSLTTMYPNPAGLSASQSWSNANWWIALGGLGLLFFYVRSHQQRYSF
jgi:hypothetical protein